MTDANGVAVHGRANLAGFEGFCPRSPQPALFLRSRGMSSPMQRGFVVVARMYGCATKHHLRRGHVSARLASRVELSKVVLRCLSRNSWSCRSRSTSRASLLSEATHEPIVRPSQFCR
jgi:hypothetical protein